MLFSNGACSFMHMLLAKFHHFFYLLGKWPDILLIILPNICVIDQTRGYDGLVVGIGPVPFGVFVTVEIICFILAFI